jgi:hypothetical protein
MDDRFYEEVKALALKHDVKLTLGNGGIKHGELPMIFCGSNRGRSTLARDMVLHVLKSRAEQVQEVLISPEATMLKFKDADA